MKTSFSSSDWTWMCKIVPESFCSPANANCPECTNKYSLFYGDDKNMMADAAPVLLKCRWISGNCDYPAFLNAVHHAHWQPGTGVLPQVPNGILCISAWVAL